ncbi:MAG: VapE domain-containing protein [Armatimonadia bacterium]
MSSTPFQPFDRLPVDTIATALSYVPADDRDTWVTMAMAVKSELGDSGFTVWDEWSKTDDGYNARDAKDVWRSVKPYGRITIGTLIKLAMDHGYNHGDRPHRISEAELEERRRQREREEAAARQRVERRQSKAAKDAEEIFQSASPDGVANHPYVQRKGIQQPGDVRIGTYPRFFDGEVVEIPGALLIPIRDADRKLISLQAIFPSNDNAISRDRDYLPGALKQGGFFKIGPIGQDTKVILICEGYATGCALHQATGHSVLVAFDAGNLPNVAKMAREKRPEATIVLCADNDQWNEKGNTGVRKATEAAMLVRGIVAVPDFADLSLRPTDFDDLATLEGMATVAAQIDRVLNPAPAIPAPAPANDNSPLARYDMGAVDWYTPLPDTNNEGKKPIATIENLEEICRRMGVNVRYNVISKEIEILIPGEGFSVDNQANASLAWLTSACSRFRMPTGALGDFLCYMADRNQYNPVANWVLSRPWDGKSRLQDLFDTIKTEGEVNNEPNAGYLKEAMMRRWLLSAMAAAFLPDGVSAHGVLVLQGEQYLGKTKWFKSLAPRDLGVIQDGLSLRPDDRDSVKQAVSFWLVELGELDATFRKSDIAALKAFLTRDKDVLRRAYARLESKFARRTVFFASVNPRQFLHDPTGNRRYWTLSCHSIDHSHSIDMQQMWAEVYEAHYLPWQQKGMPDPAPWYLTGHEMAMLNEHNADFEVLDPIRERLQTRYEWSADKSFWRWLTATEIMLEVGFDKPSRSDVTQCGHIMQEMNGHQSRKSNGKKLSLVPPLASKMGYGSL